MEVRKIYTFNSDIVKQIRKENNLSVNDMVFKFYEAGHPIYPKTFYRWEDKNCKGIPSSESLMVLYDLLKQLNPSIKIKDLFLVLGKRLSNHDT